jgi:hypothetical protein
MYEVHLIVSFNKLLLLLLFFLFLFLFQLSHLQAVDAH